MGQALDISAAEAVNLFRRLLDGTLAAFQRGVSNLGDLAAAHHLQAVAMERQAVAMERQAAAAERQSAAQERRAVAAEMQAAGTLAVVTGASDAQQTFLANTTRRFKHVLFG